MVYLLLILLILYLSYKVFSLSSLVADAQAIIGALSNGILTRQPDEKTVHKLIETFENELDYRVNERYWSHLAKQQDIQIRRDSDGLISKKTISSIIHSLSV